MKFAESVGIHSTGKEALQALRRLPAEQIRGNLNMATMAGALYSGPMVDGRIVVSDPQSIFLAGAGARVPVLIGANSSDIGFGSARTKEALFAPFGASRAMAVVAYDPQGTGALAQLQAAVAADRMMIEPARFVAAVFASRDLSQLRVPLLLRRGVDA